MKGWVNVLLRGEGQIIRVGGIVGYSHLEMHRCRHLILPHDRQICQGQKHYS